MTTDIQEENFENQADAVAAGDDKDIRRVYELGYHIFPTVSEADIENEIAPITDLLKKENVDFVGERMPALINLAYPIEKIIDGAKQHFDTAYFGWIAFEAPAVSIEKINEGMKDQKNVLRYIIIKTTRDTVAATMADPGLDVGAPKPEVPEEGGLEGDEKEEGVKEEGQPV